MGKTQGVSSMRKAPPKAAPSRPTKSLPAEISGDLFFPGLVVMGAASLPAAAAFLSEASNSGDGFSTTGAGRPDSSRFFNSADRAGTGPASTSNAVSNGG